MADPEHLAILKQGVEVWNKWRKGNRQERPNLIKTDLRQTDLIGADLRQTYLIEADLRQVILSGAKLIRADLNGADLSKANLNLADLSGAILNRADLNGAKLIRTDLNGADLNGADLNGTDLSGAKLSGAKLSGAKLSGVDLRERVLSKQDLSKANLSHANLTRIQALGTNFEDANLTGACIEDWHTNSQTNFNNVICDYIYLKQDQQERRPHDPNKNFAPGEFTKLFQKTLETVDLIFRKGVDWQAFAYSFQKTQVFNDDTSLTVQSIENKGDGVFVIRVGVPDNTDKQKIEGDFWQGYEFAYKILKGQYQARIEDKDKEINRLFYLLNQREEVQKLMAEQPKVQQNFHDKVYGVAGNVEGNQNIYPSEQKNLAEAAAEIQQLLQQLERTYPSNTTSEQMVVAAKAIEQIESNPTLRQRAINAVREGGVAAFESAINHPIASFIINAIKGWQEVE